jgi:hypothetical protein
MLSPLACSVNSNVSIGSASTGRFVLAYGLMLVWLLVLAVKSAVLGL